MVKILRSVEYNGGGIPQKYRVPKVQDQENCFFWMACCSGSRHVNNGYYGDCWDLQNCSTVDFLPKGRLTYPEISECSSLNLSSIEHFQVIHAQQNTVFHSSDGVSKDSACDFSIPEKKFTAETCNIIPNVQISDNLLVDDVVDTEIFWEVFISGAWRKYSPRIGEEIEKVFKRLTPSIRDNIGKTYKNNWWCDSRFGDMLVYHSKTFQISPLYMLQRDIATGTLWDVRRRKVELHSCGFSSNHWGSSSIWAAETGSSTESQKCSTPEDKLSPKEKSLLKKHTHVKNERLSNCDNGRTNEHYSKRSSSKEDENFPLNQGYPRDSFTICKNWKTWNTSQILTFLRIMNYHQYCDVVEGKGVTGKELSQLGEADLINGWGMAAYHAAQFLEALRNMQVEGVKQLGSVNSDCTPHSNESYSHSIKSGQLKSRDDSRSHEWCPLESEIAKPGITFGHAREESLILQFQDHDLSDSSVLSSLSRSQADSQILKMKSDRDGAAFPTPSLPSEECYQPNTTFHSDHKYSLGSLIKCDGEDFALFSNLEESKRKDEFLYDWPILKDEKMITSIPESKLRISEKKMDQSISSNKWFTSDNERPLTLIYKSETNTISESEISQPEHSSNFENLNDSYKQPPKFDLSAIRICQECKLREEDDQNRYVNRSRCAGGKFNHEVDAKSTCLPWSQQTICKIPIADNNDTLFSDRSDSEVLEKRCGRSRSYRHLNDEYPLVSFGSTMDNLDEYQDLDNDVAAVIQFLKGTRISFQSSVLKTAGAS